MPTECTAVLLANSGTSGYSEEVPALSLVAPRERRGLLGAAACKPTLPVDGAPAIARWMRTVRACPRLLPVAKKVFVVSCPETHGPLVDWAKGERFPEESIVQADAPGGPADGLAALLKSVGGLGGTLVLIECDRLFEPDFTLSRIVEHAMVLAKDCVTFTAANSFIPSPPHCSLSVEGRSPKVVAVDPAREPAPGDAVLGPVSVLRRSTAEELARLAADGHPGPRQLAALLEGLLSADGAPPVHALHFGECFSVETLEAYLFTHFFLRWLGHQRRQEGPKPPRGGARPPDELTPELIAEVMQARPTAWSERPDIRPMLEEFQTIYENRQRDAILKPERELPERFADATRWKYRTAKQEHPVYSTSNNTYGASAPAQQQMVKVYHGIDGSFTNGFNNNFKKPALNTSKTRSRVHGELDEF